MRALHKTFLPLKGGKALSTACLIHTWTLPICCGFVQKKTTKQNWKSTKKMYQKYWRILEPTLNQFLKILTNLLIANHYLCTSIGTTNCMYLSLVHLLILFPQMIYKLVTMIIILWTNQLLNLIYKKFHTSKFCLTRTPSVLTWNQQLMEKCSNKCQKKCICDSQCLAHSTVEIIVCINFQLQQ